MSVVVFGNVPTSQPDSTQTPISNLTHVWEGWDGSEWTFNRGNGVWLAPAGIRGMGMPDQITRYSRSSAALNGTQWRGWIVGERTVFWPLRIAATTDREFVDIEAAFWKTLRPDQTGKWTVILPGGQSRSLVCRFVDDGNQGATAPAFVIGREWYGITLVAEQPFWQGLPVQATWAAPQQFLFLGGGDPATDAGTPAEVGPPLFISDGNGYGTAAMTNPGDVEAWPVWAMDGPTTSGTVGVGDATIEVPFAISAGQRLIINSDPAAQTAILGDQILNPDGTVDRDRLTEVTGTLTDRTDDLGTVAWASIPAGTDIDLSVSTVGGGSVTAQIVPLYLRAW